MFILPALRRARLSQQELLTIAATPQPDAAASLKDRLLTRLPPDIARRGGGLALAIAIELLIVLLLLTIGLVRDENEAEAVAITSFDVGDPAPEQQQSAEENPATDVPRAAPSPQSQPDSEVPVQRPPVLPIPFRLSPPESRPAPSPAPVPTPTPTTSGRIGAVIRSDSAIGPADTGSSRGEDSPVVGTAPDGSPLYAASWFREPTNDQLSGYLSAAQSPGWGLIACKTAPNWRVEDCEVVSEYPANSGIARATQAAAWQFQVRPPRIGGEYQVGSWVRIRIDYANRPRVRGY